MNLPQSFSIDILLILLMIDVIGCDFNISALI